MWVINVKSPDALNAGNKAPKDINEMMYHIAAKLLEPFGIEAKEYRRWTGLQ